MVGIVVLLVMNYTPTFSAFWGGIVTALVLSMLRKETRLNLDKIVRIMYNSAKTAMTLGTATAVVGIVVGTFSLTGITMTIARIIFQVTGGVKLLTLVMTMLVAMILGMGLPTSAAYVLASISAAPALTLVGISDLYAHLFVFYYGCMSTITPPVATGAYTAAGLSGGCLLYTSPQVDHHADLILGDLLLLHLHGHPNKPQHPIGGTGEQKDHRPGQHFYGGYHSTGKALSLIHI